MKTTDRTEETFDETCARYLARYGMSGLREMAAEYRLGQRGGWRLPPRYAIAADVLATVEGME